MEIGEVIVVEGESDRVQVLRAVQADIVVTGGSRIRKDVYARLGRVAHSRGIIILTDPDYAGEQIRRQIAARFPQAKHAFVPRGQATQNGDIGIENADPALIAQALGQVRGTALRPEPMFTWADMVTHDLAGTPRAAKRRERLGAVLRIGYGNAKAFLNRLNALDVSRAEFVAAVERLKEEGL
ncbi:MAG: ribonuclease M5 [Firmicutes bacterium]|nr:ribonuclease M5 [Bacillota bacterium]